MRNKPTLAVITAIAALTSFAALAQVVPPPLPPGSARAKPHTGQTHEEGRRMLRAHKHHHRFHYRKDVTRDDSEDHDHRDADRNEPRRDERNERRQGR